MRIKMMRGGREEEEWDIRMRRVLLCFGVSE